MTERTIELVVDRHGTVACLYSEDLDFTQLGQVEVRRASHCEPDEQGQWWADLSPVGGPKLGPYLLRSLALAAEVAWLRRNTLGIADAKENACGQSS